MSDATQEPGSRRRFLLASGASLLFAAARPPAWSADARVRLAVVGGNFGAAQYWHEHPRCTVTAVSDLVPERRARLSQVYGCKDAFPSLEDMLEQAADRFDAVAIFTDAPSHAEHATLCMRAGKHVTSACPVAFSLEDCRKVKEVKEETGLVYMMHESSYYRQPAIAARKLYQAGEFGKLAYSEVEYYHPGIGTPADCAGRWRGEENWRFGVPPLFYPTHSLGLLVGVTGERIVSVSAQGTLVGDGFPVGAKNRYDNSFNNEMALGRTDAGNTCRFGTFWMIAADGERAQWLGEKLSCYMGGSGGQPEARMRMGERWERWDVPEYWKTEPLPGRMRHASHHGGSSVFLCAEFIDAILQRREPAVNIYEAIAMTAPGIVAHQSALAGGKLLEVPSFDPPGTRPAR